MYCLVYSVKYALLLKKVLSAMASSAQHFQLSLCIWDCTCLLVPASVRKICLARPVDGSDSLVKLAVQFFNIKTRDRFCSILSLVSRPSLLKPSLITCKQDRILAAQAECAATDAT